MRPINRVELIESVSQASYDSTKRPHTYVFSWAWLNEFHPDDAEQWREYTASYLDTAVMPVIRELEEDAAHWKKMWAGTVEDAEQARQELHELKFGKDE